MLPDVAHPLHSSRLKLDWANRYINTLDSQIGQFVEQHPKRVVEKVDPRQTGGYVYEVEWPDTPADWSLILGDIAHNLRSALDHVAWQVARLNGPPPRRLYFPIYTHPNDYRAQRHNWEGKQIVLPVAVGGRLFPRIPRHSERFRTLYRRRASVERAFGDLKNHYGLAPLRVRGLERVVLHADLTMLARLGQALCRARAVPLAA